MSEKDLKQALIKAGFLHAQRVGFNDKCLVEACNDLELPSTSAAIVRRGPIEVVDYAMATWLEQMKQDLALQEQEQEGWKDMKIRERVHAGLKTRLELVLPYENVWPQGMALGLQPKNFPNTLQQIHCISDQVWISAGDESLDMSWYTKRALASKIYAATEVYMMQDKSANKADTWAFMDRQIGAAQNVGYMIRNNKAIVETVGGSIISAVGSFMPGGKPFDDSKMRQKQQQQQQEAQASDEKK